MGYSSKRSESRKPVSTYNKIDSWIPVHLQYIIVCINLTHKTYQNLCFFLATLTATRDLCVICIPVLYLSHDISAAR